MKMKFRIAALALVAALTGAPVALADNGQQTTTLLTPSGQPVGGMWQRWMNDSHMPTYNGSMVLDLNLSSAAGCGYAGFGQVTACTTSSGFTPESPGLSAFPETTLNVSSMLGESRAGLLRDAKWTLLYEQAHVVDMAMLTDSEREQFAELWHRSLPTDGTPVVQWWWDGEGANDFFPVGEWFASDYMICAVWPKLTWSIDDWNANTGWDGADAIILSTHPEVFPVYTIVRTPVNNYGKHGRDRLTFLRPSRHQSEILRTQNRSCSLIRSWLS